MADVIAICARLSADAQATGVLPLAGSEVRTCFDCGALIVLSPSTVKEQPRWSVCHGCGYSLIDEHPELMLRPTPDAIRDYMELEERRRGA